MSVVREFNLAMGPFVTRVKTDVDELWPQVLELYGAGALRDNPGFTDFHVDLVAPGLVRRWFRPQVQFRLDGQTSFHAFPRAQALPMLEWGMNGCICSRAHHYVIFHAACIERRGVTVIMPADPGAGKSTLSAALAYRGWRLLSDELTLLDPRNGLLVALARPVSLKNESIDVIRAFEPTAKLSASVIDTKKGTIALLAAPRDSIDRMGELGRPRAVVFPRWRPAASASLTPVRKSIAFMQLARQSYNYSLHGVQGFNALANLIDASSCYRFEYSALEDAVRLFEDLALVESDRCTAKVN